jgi:DNA-binding LytR/AlgR family response regulator
MYKCIIIDDEELARVLLKSYVSKVNFLELVGSFENPLDALDCLKNGDIEVFFLDIQMPKIKGADFAKIIPQQQKSSSQLPFQNMH